jgi:hypothetical protein
MLYEFKRENESINSFMRVFKQCFSKSTSLQYAIQIYYYVLLIAADKL